VTNLRRPVTISPMNVTGRWPLLLTAFRWRLPARRWAHLIAQYW